MTATRNVAVLGATGSIGQATCQVLHQLAASQRLSLENTPSQSATSWRVYGLAAHRSVETLLRLAELTEPQRLVLSDDSFASQTNEVNAIRSKYPLSLGPDALVELATAPEVDTVVAAIVGSAGMLSTLAAVESGKRLALANKEALVVAGELVTTAAQKSGSTIYPVDSEHSAIFQALHAGDKKDLSKLVLTASGGPFLRWPKEQLSEATIAQATHHPNWAMGRKITIDSATMMNKALEVIEARWLFQVPAEKIQVVVHPQSIVHSMVEFNDGSVIAQLSPPDMKLPIQLALTYPDRFPCPAPSMDWTKNYQLGFEPVDFERFPALLLGFEVAKVGGTSGAVLNAANEAAVELFLAGKIRLTDIVSVCRTVLDHHTFESVPTLERLLQLDRWARQEVLRWN